MKNKFLFTSLIALPAIALLSKLRYSGAKYHDGGMASVSDLPEGYTLTLKVEEFGKKGSVQLWRQRPLGDAEGTLQTHGIEWK